jgi:hypothetical protein
MTILQTNICYDITEIVIDNPLGAIMISYNTTKNIIEVSFASYWVGGGCYQSNALIFISDISKFTDIADINNKIIKYVERVINAIQRFE